MITRLNLHKVTEKILIETLALANLRKAYDIFLSNNQSRRLVLAEWHYSYRMVWEGDMRAARLDGITNMHHDTATTATLSQSIHHQLISTGT